jgi:hypothetical protein
MKKYIGKLFAIGTILWVGASCEDDAELTYLKDVRFAAPVSTSPAAVVITNANKYDVVETISWEDVDFPVDAPVTYALQFDVVTDTIGNTAWSNSIRVEAGEAVLSKSFIGNELNQMATALGLSMDVAGRIAVRVEATLDRKIYSNAVILTVTPFTPQVAFGQIYMPGAYQGWDLATAATLPAIDSGVYQGYLTFPAGQLEFQFNTDITGGVSYGADNSGNFAENGANNLSVPSAGSYQITVNLNTMTYSAVPYSWGIIGTSTVGQWNTDTDMVYDYELGTWKFTGALMPGALKFRLNDSWTINYGPFNNDEGVVYLDNPGAHTITEAGNYVVTFFIDPSIPASAAYTVVQF